MKKIILSLLLFGLTLTPSSIFADSFTIKDKVINGDSSVMKEFYVKKGEVVTITATNKSNGRISIYIENEAGRIVSNPLTLEDANDRPKKDSTQVTLPSGTYFLRVYGGHNFWNGKDKTTGKFTVSVKCKKL